MAMALASREARPLFAANSCGLCATEHPLPWPIGTRHPRHLLRRHHAAFCRSASTLSLSNSDETSMMSRTRRQMRAPAPASPHSLHSRAQLLCSISEGVRDDGTSSRGTLLAQPQGLIKLTSESAASLSDRALTDFISSPSAWAFCCSSCGTLSSSVLRHEETHARYSLRSRARFRTESGKQLTRERFSTGERSSGTRRSPTAGS